MTRLCGYCRQNGHTKNKCPMLEEKLNAIRTHVPAERKAIHDLLLKNGYGVGAIVLVDAYGFEEPQPAVITTLKIFSEPRLNLLGHRNVKYQKRSAISLLTFTGIDHGNYNKNIIVDGEMRLKYIDNVRLPGMLLSDTTRDPFCNVRYDKLGIQSKERRLVPRNFIYEYHAQVVSPSYDTDVTDEHFLSPIAIPLRLARDDKEYVTGQRSW